MERLDWSVRVIIGRQQVAVLSNPQLLGLQVIGFHPLPHPGEALGEHTVIIDIGNA